MPPEDVAKSEATTFPAADAAKESDQSRPGGATQEGSDQSKATSVSEPNQESDRSKDWLGDAMRAMRSSQYVPAAPAKGAPPVSEEGKESKADDDEGAKSVQPSAEEKSPKAPKQSSTEGAVSLSQEELERRVQSEVDRRLHKFQEEQAARRKQAELQNLRKKDPYAYVEAVEEEEERQKALADQIRQAQSLAVNSLRAYDTAVLDPLFGMLPEKERKDILDNIEDGIAGRGKAAASAFKALERHWKQAGISEARRVLLNDQAFVKEVFAKYGNGGRIEPESVPASVASSDRGSDNMNDLIRRMAGRPV